MSYFADFDNELCSYMCYCGDLMASFAHMYLFFQFDGKFAHISLAILYVLFC